MAAARRRRGRRHQRPGRGLGADAAAPRPRPGAPAVTVLEASPRLGGPLQSDEVGGRVVDLGPDGFLGRRPEAVDLCREVGLGDALEPVAARGASVWARGRLRPLPEGLALGIPTRFWPTARSGIVGVRGSLGLARDAVLPRPDVPRPDRRPRHRTARVAQARPARGRHVGRSPHRRDPCRFGRRHVGGRDLPAAAGGRAAPGWPHARPARRSAGARPRRTTALLGTRRRHGLTGRRAGGGAAASAAWTICTSSPADRLERATPRRLDRGRGRSDLRGGRRGAGHTGTGGGGPSHAARRRGGRTAAGHRLRLGGPGDVPGRHR